MSRWARRFARMRDDKGFTLIELLIGGVLLMVLMSVAATTLIGVSQGTDQARTQHDLNEEARNALNRVAREIRQASALTFAANPDGPAYAPNGLVALSFKADFNGDGCAGNAPACPGTDNATNPESLTYCFNPSDPSPVKRTYLWLIPTGLPASTVLTTCQIPGALPILAGNVSRFKVEYRSNLYRFDIEPPIGVTTWRELDQAPPPTGDSPGPDGNINTSAIAGVNSMVFHLTMSKDGHTQAYSTQVDMRNKP